ncbi:tetratricopeptide repeat protein [Tenacibaculum adriaticum]|nr:hypothetical protein [Tenacibaculum adriaticum]
MKKRIHIIFVIFLGINLSSCEKELVDFTEVTNPELSESSIIGQPNSAQSWLYGVERQMAELSNEYVTISEIASDNYENTQTFYNQLLDNLNIDFQDADMSQLHFDIAKLREMALFGLNRVAPNDINSSNNTLAEFNFYKGISHLLAGEYFSFLPAEANGVPLSSEENLNLAIESFNTALSLSNSASYHMAIARANYSLGNKAEAVTAAQDALNLDATLLMEVAYDQSNGPSNTMEAALYGRGTFDDLQPLPSLDFLDPKYSFLSNDIDQPLYFLKAEEAHLIIAEAQLSDNDLPAAQTTLKNLLTLINSRDTRTIDDTVEGRDQDHPGSRPDNSSIVVKYEGDIDFKTGLVIDRSTTVTVPVVSGTSVTDVDIDALASIDEALELLFLVRQEVFIAEGRRVIDLGIKYVIHETELLLNPNIDENNPGLTRVIPPFIDSIKAELDDFTYDAGTGTVIIKHNLNKILVQNKTSNLVLPFN